MRKILFKVVLGLLLAGVIFSFSVPVLALDPPPGEVQEELRDLPSELEAKGRIASVVNWLLGIAATVAVLLIVVSGIRYIVSAGNQQEIDDAKKTITYAVIGLVITILAIVIVNVIIRIIGD